MKHWRKYNGAIIPDVPPHIIIHNTDNEIKEFINRSNTFFARWESEFDCNTITNFWFVINDKPMEMIDYDAKTRNKIKKGLKHCIVKRIIKDDLISQGYDVYFSAFKKYNTYLKAKENKDYIKEIEKNPDSWEYWGVFHDNILIAYSKVMVVNKYAEYRSTKFHPKFLRYRPSEALIYTMNRNYLNERKFTYVNNGTRSISHQTNFPDFLVKKFKFRKAYCKLNVIYSMPLGILITLLFPFRFIFKLFNFGPFRQLNILLKQEMISRSFN